MTLPGGADPGPDQLSGGLDRSRVLKSSATAVVVGAIAIGAVVLATGNAHHASSRRATAAVATPRPAQRSAPAAPVTTAKPGTVFLEHLPKCTSTDHHHVLTVAFGVTNLAARPLVLLGAAPLTNGDGVLQLTGVRLGLGSCAAGGGKDPVRLAPAADAIVAMTFRVGEECPRNVLIAARVTFDTGATGIVHADSSGLTNLDGLRFTQC